MEVAAPMETCGNSAAAPNAAVLDFVSAYVVSDEAEVSPKMSAARGTGLASSGHNATKPLSTTSTAARQLLREVIAARQNHELRTNKGAKSRSSAPTAAPSPQGQTATDPADARGREVAVRDASAAGAPLPADALVVATCDADLPLEEESIAYLLNEARTSYARAEELLDLGLTQCEDWMSLRDRFYDAGALFAISGCTTESARCLLSASFINRAFGDEDEAISTLNASAESLKVELPAMAAEVLERLVVCYDRAQLHFQSAKCLRDAAMIVDERLDDLPRAIELFTRAVDAYDHKTPKEGRMGALQRSLRESCFERLCFLHIIEGHYDIAEKMFMEKARERPSFVPTTRFFMSAVLCVLARGSADEDAFFDALYLAKKRFEALQFEDRGLQRGKEQLFLKTIIEAFECNSLNQLDRAWAAYKSYKTTIPSAAMDVVMAQIRQNLYDHLERYTV